MGLGKSMRMFIGLAVLTGVVYPLAVTGMAQWIWPQKAKGSLLMLHEKPIGSVLIAQKFSGNAFFWPRPSAHDYNPLASGGSNLSWTSKKLKEQVEARKESIMKAHGIAQDNKNSIPNELLFASGSGLDPHISLKAAYFQIPRVIKARGWNEEIAAQLKDLVDVLSEGRQLGLLGEPRVNVLKLNLSLEAFASDKTGH